MRLATLGSLGALLLGILVVFGRVHVDEGGYHEYGTLVADGLLPYRDFLYVQAPVYPYVAGLVRLVLGPSLILARAAHAAMGLAALLLGGLLARRGGRLGVPLYAALLLPNLFTLYHLTFVKLYAPAALFLTASFVLFERDGLSFQCGALVMAALAAGTRLSLAPAFVILAAAGIFLRGRRMTAPLVAGGLTLAAIFLPHYAIAAEQMLYSMTTYHFEKDAFTPTQALVYRLDSLSGIASHFWPAILLAAAVAWGAEPLSAYRELSVSRLLPWVVAGGLLATHLLARGPNLHPYLAIAYPYVASQLAASAAGFFDRLGALQRTALAGSMLAFATVLPAQVRETIDLRMPPGVLRVAEVARDLAALTRPGDDVVSFMNSVIVIAGRRTLPGFEMHAVTYDRAWDMERCRKFRILRKEELLEALEEGRVAACLITEDTFLGNFPRFYNPGERGTRPDAIAAIERRFRIARTYPGFGHFGKDATLWVRKEP